MKKIKVVLKKEIIDCLRDKRSLISMLLPIIIFPFLLTIYNVQIEKASESLSEKINIVTDDKYAVSDIKDIFLGCGFSIEVSFFETPEEKMKSGDSSLIMQKLENGYRIIYDQSSIKSTKALEIISGFMENRKNQYIKSVLLSCDKEKLKNYNYYFEDISLHTEKTTNTLISVLGPLLIVMFITTGGTSVAIDIFSGEKERGAMESVLATQINRKDLFVGKMVAVFIFVCFGALISSGGYLLSFLLNKELASTFGKTGLGLSFSQIAMFVVVIIIFAFFTATIISVLSLCSKTAKEASLKMNIFTIVPTLIGGISVYMEPSDISFGVNLFPIINIINVLKSIFIGNVEKLDLLICLLSTIVYGILFLLIGVKITNSEKILEK